MYAKSIIKNIDVPILITKKNRKHFCTLAKVGGIVCFLFFANQIDDELFQFNAKPVRALAGVILL